MVSLVGPTLTVSGAPLWAGPLDWEVRRLVVALGGRHAPRKTLGVSAWQENQSLLSDHSIT